jgi:hypothetical protein
VKDIPRYQLWAVVVSLLLGSLAVLYLYLRFNDAYQLNQGVILYFFASYAYLGMFFALLELLKKPVGDERGGHARGYRDDRHE